MIANNIDKIAEKLDLTIFMGKDFWVSILYCLISTHTPKIIINGVEQRGILHFNMIGEVSSAKTSVLNIVKKIAPKYVLVTRMTEASFEGISRQKEIERGIIEHSEDGALLIPEFRRTLSKFQLLREVMDCGEIRITKRGITKPVDVNLTFIVGSNPKDDFFKESGIMRKDIPFEEGVLSRFDFLIPLVMTEAKNESILKSMQLFGGKITKKDLKNFKVYLGLLQTQIRDLVKGITITFGQEEALKNAFRNHNQKLGNRTLVILRDLETLCRLVNTTVAINYMSRDSVKGVYQAKDEDIEKAIDIWENIIYSRKQLYENRDTKEISTPKEKLLSMIPKNEGIETQDLLELMLADKVCSRSTFYRYVDTLKREGIIEVIDANKETSKVIWANTAKILGVIQ